MKPSELDRNRIIIEKIKKYCDDITVSTERFGKSFAEFSADVAYQHACTMCLLQIGELANHLTAHFCATNPHIQWRHIIGLRNILAHEYDKLDVARIWATIETDLPALRSFCESAGKV